MDADCSGLGLKTGVPSMTVGNLVSAFANAGFGKIICVRLLLCDEALKDPGLRVILLWVAEHFIKRVL